jgi:predicted lysophospholipase L1 biosynthesis ABC-type transport system permease subunit
VDPRGRAAAGRRQSALVRAAGDPASMVGAVRSEVQSLDPSILILRARTLEEQLDADILQERFLAALCSFFGLLALLLAAIGLYGVMAGSVARRTREIGIRIALDAQQGRVLRMVLREAVLLLVIGAAVAVPSALAVTRLARSMTHLLVM